MKRKEWFVIYPAAARQRAAEVRILWKIVFIILYLLYIR